MRTRSSHTSARKPVRSRDPMIQLGKKKCQRELVNLQMRHRYRYSPQRRQRRGGAPSAHFRLLGHFRKNRNERLHHTGNSSRCLCCSGPHCVRPKTCPNQAHSTTGQNSIFGTIYRWFVFLEKHTLVIIRIFQKMAMMGLTNSYTR